MSAHSPRIGSRIPAAVLIAVLIAVLGMVSIAAPAATVNAVWDSATDVPVTAYAYTATGNTVNFALNFAPATGTDLMVVDNTWLGFISGTFNNLTNGQRVALSYGGVLYNFVANYYCGTGNDLVLVWAGKRAFAWGANGAGQLGDSTQTQRHLPVPVNATGVLAGKTVVALAAGYLHSLALCSDGTVAAWGDNTYGQLGDNSTNSHSAPVAVSTAAGVSALSGKLVVGVAAGYSHSLALCSDGTVAAWGRNFYGQLGDTTTTTRLAPVAVNTNSPSALYGQTVVAIAAGFYHNLALCYDGKVVAWGLNGDGQLGDNRGGFGVQRTSPVIVNVTSGLSALADKTVSAVAAGSAHSLALCSDGTLAAWGQNTYGELGDGSLNGSLVPLGVEIRYSALYGRTVTSIGTGSYHSLAACTDGSVVAWGKGYEGELGNGSTDYQPLATVVSTTWAPSVLVSAAAGYYYSLAWCTDGTLATWGANGSGQLGDNSTSQRNTPVPVNTTPLAAGERFTWAVSGPAASHTLALVAEPPAPPIKLTGAKRLANGSFQFGYTNLPGTASTVLAATNPALPLANWTSLTGLTEVSPGQFQFTDPQAANMPRRFYRVRSP